MRIPFKISNTKEVQTQSIYRKHKQKSLRAITKQKKIDACAFEETNILVMKYPCALLSFTNNEKLMVKIHKCSFLE